VIRSPGIGHIVAGNDRASWYKPRVGSAPPRRRRARALAEIPTEALARRAEELAKGWLVALVEQLPLAAAAAIRTGELASAGPEICATMLRGLTADRELERVASGGDLRELVSRVGELAGARDAAETSNAVEALRAVLWSAVLAELADPDPVLVGDLAERLALVAETVREAALVRFDGSSITPAREDSEWPGILERAVADARRRGVPLSLLLAELEDAGRVVAIEPSQDVAELFDRFQAIVRRAIRPGDIVAGQEPGRVWVIASATEADDAAELAAGLAAAVASEEPWRGAPLRATIGLATLDEDGSDALGLIEAAEEAAFVSASRGIEVSRRTDVDPD
jgi:GGDEF domain-containing protein